MPTRDAAPAGAPCWIDLMCADTARQRAFYGEIFGWQAEQQSDEFGGYFMWTRDGVEIAGGMPAEPGQPVPGTWSVYLAVDDVDKTLELATAAGAQVVVPRMEVGDSGIMAVLVDPTGAAIGVWQRKDFPGLRVYAEHRAPAWFELLTRDYDAAVTFYRDVFGWDAQTLSDTPDFRYTTLGSGESALAGIMDANAVLADGEGPYWGTYFSVEDTDANLVRVTELGGRVVRAPEDTPHGRLATALDPAGARFKLVGPTAS